MLTNYKYHLNWLIKLAIVVFAVLFICKQLRDNKNLQNFPQLIRSLNSSHIWWTLAGVCLLMLVNWLLESYKWRMQLSDIAPISMRTAIQSILCGLTVGIITPNRIGDYGSRVFFLKPRMRTYGLIAMATAAIGQYIIINIMAAIAICTFLYSYKSVDMWIVMGIATGFTLYCTLLMLLYFNMGVLRPVINKLKFLDRYQHFFEVLSNYKNSLLIKILFIYLLRIAILITQYYLIIHLLIPSMPFRIIILMTALLIGLQTVIPTIELLDIGVRGATAVYVFSFVTHQDVSILATTSLIWFINLIIPAIIGLGFVHKLKLFNQPGVQL